MNNGLDKLKARRYMLDKQLKEMKDRITGRNNSFYPFITDKKGSFSERKLAHFINEILDGYQKYGERSFWFDFESDPELRELCECFLYCAILGIAEYDESEKYAVRPARLFSDICDLAAHKNNLFFTDKNTLHKYEFYSSIYDSEEGESRYFSELNEGGFFRNSDMAYFILTGKHIVSTFSEDEYKKLQSAYDLERAKKHGYDSYEDYAISEEKAVEENERIADIEAHPEDMEFVSNDRDDNELIEMQKKKNAEWKSAVISPEKFAEKYLRFRELFFARSMFYRYHLFEEIELMIDIFLYENKLSAFSEEEIFAMVYYKTDIFSTSMGRLGKKE